MRLRVQHSKIKMIYLLIYLKAKAENVNPAEEEKNPAEEEKLKENHVGVESNYI